MAQQVDSHAKSYNSFSGVDMRVTFGGREIGEVQGISYTVQREKAPVYTMGSADPRSFSRGKRGIAGSVIFMVFDRSALIETLHDRPILLSKTERHRGEVGEVRPVLTNVTGVNGSVVGTTGGVQAILIDKVLVQPAYHDQVLPFEIVITAANEYGSFATMTIHGAEIMNAGSGMSIDDITTDEACTFIARAITPWHSQGMAFNLIS